MEERFTYTVNPRRPIRNLIKGKTIVRSENLSLTKSEVLFCLKFGPVYRKFYKSNKLERVLPSNLDRLHRKDYLTEKEYNNLLEKDCKVASGFFDYEDSGVTDPYSEKKDPTEEQSFPDENNEEESVSEVDNIEFNETDGDDSVELNGDTELLEDDSTEESVDDNVEFNETDGDDSVELNGDTELLEDDSTEESVDDTVEDLNETEVIETKVEKKDPTEEQSFPDENITSENTPRPKKSRNRSKSNKKR